MKKILIVVPGCETGGVLTSLIALLNSTFVNRYQVNIFIISGYKKKINPIVAKYDIGNNFWTSKVHSYVLNARGWNKFVLSCYKVLFRVPWLGNRIINHIESVAIRKIESHDYYCVISFQEEVSLQFVSKFSNPNKVAWIHCDYSRIFTNKTTEMRFFAMYPKIVTVSNYTRESFCKLLPELANRVHVIYNIMDKESIMAKAEQKIEDRNFSTNNFTIISVGRISEVKQFDKIPAIASILKSKGYSFMWYILGGINEPPAFEKLQRSITEHSVEDCVICLGNKSNPYPYFKAANLLVSTSYSEACPMIFNEAKILNLPILTNNYGSAYEFIKEEQDGLICEIDQMADVITNIIEKKFSFMPSISKAFDTQAIQNQIDKVINI